MNNKIVISTFFCIVCTLANYLQCNAQLHNAHWFFGNGCGMNFVSNLPYAISNTNISALEGTSSFSNPSTGALMLYTDGIQAWDKNHNIMPSTNTQFMGGHNSTTHGSVIIQKLDSLNMFYIFSCGAQAGAFDTLHTGITYSIVDLNLNGGNGDVVASNIPLLDSATEKMAVFAVGDEDKKYYWLLTHRWNSDTFYAYKISKNGISNPIKSKAGSWITGPNTSNTGAMGQMQFSPNGDRVAVAHLGLFKVQLFNFDKNTGIVSANGMSDSAYSNLGPYGCAFSPDGSKLYTTEYGLTSAKLFQYDLNTNNNASILASRTAIVNSTVLNKMAGMIVGLDNKIYISIYGFNTMATINNPNLLGTPCNFNATGFTLNTGASTYSGVPTIYNKVIYDTLVNLPNGIESFEKSDDYCIYPNPVQNILLLKGDHINQLQAYKIFNANFQLINDGVLQMNQGLVCANLLPGIYYLQINDKLLQFRKL